MATGPSQTSSRSKPYARVHFRPEGGIDTSIRREGKVWQNAEFPELEEVKDAENVNPDEGTSASTSALTVPSVPVPSPVKEPVRTPLETIETAAQGNAARKKPVLDM